MSDKKPGHDFEDFQDFQDFPDEPTPVNTVHTTTTVHHAHALDDGYADIAEEHEGEGHEEIVDEEHAEGEAEEEEARRPNLISRAIIPVGVVVLGLAGLGTAWQMGLFGGSTDTAQQVAVSQPVQTMPSTMPNLAPRQVVAAQPSLPTLPQTSSAASPVMTLPARLPETGTPAVAVPARLPATTAPALPVTAGTTPAQGTSTGDMPEVARSINRLVVEMEAANKTAAASNEVGVEIRGMRDMMVGKFDSLGTQITMMGSRLDGMDGKFASLEQRVAAMEGRSSQSASPSRTAAPVPAPVTSKPGTSRTHEARPRKERESSSAPVASVAVGDYKLVGASRDSALIQTPSGSMVQVQIGKALPNGSIAKGFRQEGQDFILITSSGDVRP